MATLSQAQVEQWIAQNGGPSALQYGVEKKQVRNPEYDPINNPLVPQYVDIEVEVWKNGKTNATLTVRRLPDGNLEQIENIGADPNKPAAANDGPPGGKPYIDEDGPNGRRLGWNPATKQYDRDLGPSPSAQKGPDVKRTTINRNGKVYIQVETKNPDGTSSLHFEDQQGNKVSLPDEVKAGDTKTESVKGSDGRIYTRVTTISADGQTTAVKNFGPDGKQVSEIPGEGPSTPRTAGPPLPNVVLGASQDAARTYKQQLQEGVASGRWSQAWADARWKEFMEVANLAVSEAATRQRNEESQRNAEFNIANARMGSMNTATSNALTFVNSINGLLPAGSNLGGKAFAALLGMNMLQSQMSGMNRIDPRRVPAPLTTADIANPAALDAKRDELGQAIREATPTVIAATDANIGRLTQLPAPTPAPAAPAPVATAPPISQQARDDHRTTTVTGVDAIPPGVTPVPGTGQVPGEAGDDQFVGGRVLPQPGSEAGPDPMDQAPQPAPYEETVTVRHRGMRGTKTVTRAYWEQYKAQHPWLSQMWAEGPAEPGAPPAPTHLDPTVPYPSNADPNSEGVPQSVPEIRDPIDPTPPAVQKAMPNPAGEWAALAPMAPQPQMPTQQQPAMPQMGGEPVAVRRARIASTPPWKLTAEELDWAEQNGYGQEAWAVPGRVA